MVKLLDNTKISMLDYLFMAFIIFYAARANAFVRGLGNPFSVGNAVALAFTIVMIFKHKVKFYNHYIVSIIILVVYTLLTFVAHSYLSFGFIPRYFIYLSIAYVICQVYGIRLYVVYESVVVPLIIIAMIIWFFHLISPAYVHSIVESLSLPTFSDNPNYITYNCIFYTINGEEDRLLGDYYLFTRNAGFAWEPGAFACLACLGLACNLLRNSSKLINVPNAIYLAAIFTTQSTTGYFILASIIFIWVLVNKKFFWAIVLSPIVIYVFGLSFVSEKFIDEYSDVSLATNLYSVQYHGRLFGLVASWAEFIHHPIIGLGGARETFVESEGLDATIFSGLGFLMTRFGLILTILFFVLLFRSEFYTRSYFKNRGGFYIIAVISLSMISYMLWDQPLFLAFSLMSIYCPKKKMVSAANRR